MFIILIGSIAVKCKKKIAFWNVKIFCLELPNSSKKPIKKSLHFKMLTIQNVKFEMPEYSNTTILSKTEPEYLHRNIYINTYSNPK